MSEWPSDIKVDTFRMRDVEAPARVYSTPAHDGTERRIVAFTPIGHQYPCMFIYVDGFDESVALAREIAAAHRAGNVDAYIGRWEREHEAARRRAERP